MQPTPSTNETLIDGITLRDLLTQVMRFLGFLRRRALILVAGAVLGAVLGAGLGIAFPGKASAVFHVRLSGPLTENPVAVYGRKNVEFFAAAEQNFVSTPLIRETLVAQGVAEPTDAMLADTRRRLSFYPIGSNAFTGRFQADSGEEARAFLDAHVARYIDAEVKKTLAKMRGEVDFLRAERDKLETELRDAEKTLREFKEKHADGLPEQAKDHYLLLRALQQKKVELAAQLDQVTLELKLNNEKLKGEKLFVESKVISTQRAQPYQDSILRTKQQIAEAEAAKLSEDHPEMKRLRTLMAQLQKMNDEAKKESQGDTEVEKKRNPTYESIQDAVYHLEIREQVVKNEIEQTALQLERAERIVADLPQLEARFAEITRSYDTTLGLQRRIFEQLKVAEIQIALEEASLKARYDIISPPAIEYVSAVKRIVTRAIVMLVAGLALAFVIAATIELRNFLRDLG